MNKIKAYLVFLGGTAAILTLAFCASKLVLDHPGAAAAVVAPVLGGAVLYALLRRLEVRFAPYRAALRRIARFLPEGEPVWIACYKSGLDEDGPPDVSVKAALLRREGLERFTFSAAVRPETAARLRVLSREEAVTVTVAQNNKALHLTGTLTLPEPPAGPDEWVFYFTAVQVRLSDRPRPFAASRTRP